MSVRFNPYHRWLAVPEGIQAPNHYELLGLRVGEGSAELIRSAADQRRRRLEPLLAGEHGMLARRLLAEVAAARSCLLDQRAKAEYDLQLQRGDQASADERPLPRCPTEPPVTPRFAKSPPAAPEPGPAAMPDTALKPLDDETAGPRVPMLGKMALDSILAELVAAMQECRRLYLSFVPPSQGYPKPASRQFSLSQDRLHRGLLAKVYATISEADARWTYEEQRCAAALLQHVGVPVAEGQLEQTARKIARQAAKLEWGRLLQPFWEVPELRPRIADLETVVCRMANLIAKADGHVAHQETQALQAIQERFRSEPPAAADRASRSPAVGANSTATPDSAPWERQAAPRETKPGHVDRGQYRADSLRRLDALVGLPQIKQELRELADWAAFQCQRRQAGLPHETPDLRFLFLGPAGTGKTYVARLLSELLFASGVLKHGHLVEVDGFDLTSREPRDAARLMKDKIRQAIGGTLLIDCSGALMSAGESPDGIAVRALRENLVAHADRFAVVLADRSDRLPYQLGRQPLLAQLFQRTWQFGTYRAGELGQIFQCCCDRSRYRITRPAQIKLLLGLHWQLRQDADRFGYGHGILRVFERAVHRLASRIAGRSPLTKDLLTTFHDSDIAIDGVPAQVFSDLADPRRSFRISCPGCAAVTLVGPDFLGIRVECRRCHHRFTSAWGEPME
ncbi:MAG TPA: hypothetical protein PLF81_10995 [Candidatus Anammoximicrobium sp.]|nr:hypothetical protein [Candidatus Anammoximicrobium sp.]